MSVWAKNAAAFMSLAITQRRLALKYRREAVNATSADDAKFCRAEAKRLWNEAREHVSHARHHRELGAHHGA